MKLQKVQGSQLHAALHEASRSTSSGRDLTLTGNRGGQDTDFHILRFVCDEKLSEGGFLHFIIIISMIRWILLSLFV